MRKLNVFSNSCGKDSVAQMYLAKELGIPVDISITFDSGAEYPFFYDVLEKLKKDFPKTKFIVVKPKHTLLDMLDTYAPWCARNGRWFTTCKIEMLNDLGYNSYRYNIYVGIAADEKERMKNCKGRKSLLIEHGINEKEALAICRKNGVRWNYGLFDYYDISFRMGCWCCDYQSHYDLYIKWKYFPDMWAKLKELQRKHYQPFKGKVSIFDLEYRFENGYIPDLHPT